MSSVHISFSFSFFLAYVEGLLGGGGLLEDLCINNTTSICPSILKMREI